MKNVKNIIQRRKKINRKGVIDVQFNWIFVMIAGFVIFLFIISIVFAQKRNAEAQVGISSMNQITALLKSKQQAPNIYSEINLPSTNINFKCDEATQYFTFKIENAERAQLPTEIIFAPQDLTSNKIMVWSQAFDLGFPVSVFTYITTADSIILIYNTSENPYALQIYNDLPSNVTKKLVKDTVDIQKYKGYARIKIICFSDTGCPTATQYDYTIITTKGDGLYSYGNVTFHKKSAALDPATQTASYITKSGLYGAIFSDTIGYYRCQTFRALNQFEVKRSLVESRLTLIQDVLPQGNCRKTINMSLDWEVNNMRNLYLNEDNITFLQQNIKDMDKSNTNLILDSCAKIY
jgi:hypothetical protein